MTIKRALIIDKDTSNLKAFTYLLQPHSNFFKVLTADEIGKAFDILNQTKIDLVIIALESVESEGLAFFRHIREKNPGIQIILITDDKNIISQTESEMRGIAHVFEKPVDITILTQIIFDILNIGFGGRINHISLPSFLQMLSLEEKTCTLNVQGKKKIGRLYLSKGELIAAETDTLKFEDAAIEILGWEDVTITIDFRPRKKRREILKSLMKLLMEGSKTRDEKIIEETGELEKRRSPRTVFPLAVEYQIEDWSYRTIIRNISRHGAYLETDQPVVEGQEIVIGLYSSKSGRYCDISCRVVRRNAEGIGVEFEPLDPRQMDVIRSLVE